MACICDMSMAWMFEMPMADTYHTAWPMGMVWVQSYTYSISIAHLFTPNNVPICIKSINQTRLKASNACVSSILKCLCTTSCASACCMGPLSLTHGIGRIVNRHEMGVSNW